MQALFPVRSKVRYSGHGLRRLRPFDTHRIGTVEGYAIGGSPQTVSCVRVRWPGRKTQEVLHRDYLEVVR